MVGILVHGDNHFIVRGPFPCRETALALVRHWSVIRIGAATPPALAAWQISSKEFRENLEWAIVVPGDSAHSALSYNYWTNYDRAASPSTMRRPGSGR